MRAWDEGGARCGKMTDSHTGQPAYRGAGPDRGQAGQPREATRRDAAGQFYACGTLKSDVSGRYPPKLLNPYTFGGAMLPVKRVTLKGVLPHYPGSRPPHLRHLPSSF